MNDSESRLPHDLAEVVAYAQKPYIDIARIAMKQAEQVGDYVVQAHDTGNKTNMPDAFLSAQPIIDLSRPDYTTTQAAHVLGVSRPHLVNRILIKEGMPYYSVGRDRRIPHEVIRTYLAARDAESIARLA